MAASAFLKKTHNKAGLSLHENALRYVELEGNLSGAKVVRKMAVPTNGRGVKKNSLADPGELIAPLQELAVKIGGRFKAPVALALPSRDILIRILELPEMSLEDAREALQWDFDKYFPYAFTDAAVDMGRVENAVHVEKGMMSVLVAACRLRTVESVLRMAETAEIELSTIEPESVAMFRASLGPVTSFAGGYLAIFAEHDVTQLVLGYKDNGILYRTSLVDVPETADGARDFSPLVREVANTLTFVRNQYKELPLEHLMLGGSFAAQGGLGEILQETTGLKVLRVDPWSAWGLPVPPGESAGWEAAVGLAVRDLS
jgi:type IV pilus assembly protein PilM